MSKRIVIVGGGISGMALGFRLKRDHGLEVTVLESGSQPGGKARTDVADGFTCEHGTNSWLDNEPAARDLLRDLGIFDRIKQADAAAERRFIYRAPSLREIKMHPLKFMFSSVLPLGGRIRLGMEPFVKKRVESSEETLVDFASRRLGKAAADILIGPMASGVYAGDPGRMSLKSCFKKVYNLEQKYGSLIKGMVALKKEKKRAGEDASQVKAGPSGRMTSLEGGVSDLVNALKSELGDGLNTNSNVTKISKRDSGGFTINIDGKPDVQADIVISASPAWSASQYLGKLDEDAAAALDDIPYPSLDVVCLGFKRSQVGHDLNGFGFLVPRRQNKTILGSLWTSSIFPGRAPDDHVLIRTMIGGMTEPQVGGWTEEQVMNTVREDLADILQIPIDKKPIFTRIYRHDRAIPQYHVGHSKLVQRLKNSETRHPGLFISGNSIGGVGVIDCIRNAGEMAQRVAEFAGK